MASNLTAPAQAMAPLCNLYVSLFWKRLSPSRLATKLPSRFSQPSLKVVAIIRLHLANCTYPVLSANSLSISWLPILLLTEFSYNLPSLQQADITRQFPSWTNCFATFWHAIKLSPHTGVDMPSISNISWSLRILPHISYDSTYTQLLQIPSSVGMYWPIALLEYGLTVSLDSRHLPTLRHVLNLFRLSLMTEYSSATSLSCFLSIHSHLIHFDSLQCKLPIILFA